jgi:hypothetical protein
LVKANFEEKKYWKSAWPLYWTSLGLFIAGNAMILLENKNPKSLYLPTDLTEGGAAGSLVCFSSTIVNFISWNQFYKQKRKNEFVLSGMPKVDFAINKKHSSVKLTFAVN